MNIVMYTPQPINNRVLNANRELFRKGLVVFWQSFPAFIFPVDGQKLIQSDFVENPESNSRYYLPNIQPNSGKLVDIQNRSLPGAYIAGCYFPYNILNTLGWCFRVVDAKNQEWDNGIEISKKVARDIENYTYSLYKKVNGEIPHY